jgi:rhodanese-related sulfurtransferase
VTRAWRRWLACAAALAGALAPLAGNPHGRPVARPAAGERREIAGGGIDVAELARLVADQEDHVPAVELARWIRARQRGLRVVDVRSAAEFRVFHIPGAEHVALEALAGTRFGPDETVVLYSEAGIHGAQAWVFLRALGHRRAYFLRGGLREWLDDVMTPAIAADAPADARAAFAEVAELSRWFGGTPRSIDPTAAPAGELDARLARRRGC